MALGSLGQSGTCPGRSCLEGSSALGGEGDIGISGAGDDFALEAGVQAQVTDAVVVGGRVTLSGDGSAHEEDQHARSTTARQFGTHGNHNTNVL